MGDAIAWLVLTKIDSNPSLVNDSVNTGNGVSGNGNI
jgi:hypothetical protein